MIQQLDITEQIDGAVIQHGKLSNRIYLMKYGNTPAKTLITNLIEIAEKNGYSKIFVKVPLSQAETFIVAGFEVEAAVAKMYNGKEDAMMLGYYLDENRKIEEDSKKFKSIVSLSVRKGKNPVITPLSKKYTIRKCVEEDVEPMAKIYGAVFDTYPFPIDTPEYLLETMRSHVAYFGIEAKDGLIALASAEMDADSQSVEMTDFATLPDRRGKGFAVHLLEEMETFCKDLNYKTAYTIARAVSPGMNITFAKLGYRYGGRLINNTNISGKIESMNIWHKSLWE
jgi:beta-lysine N6-acetyltransferase